MKRKTISILAFTLAASVSLSACTSAKVVADTDSNIIESSYIEEVIDNKITSNDLAFMVLLEEYYKSGKTIDEILSKEDENSVLYSSALYVKLREFGLSDETIKEELFNVVTFGLVHPYEDGWKNDLLVENLNKSLNYTTDAIIYYYPLAAYVHLFDCRLVHTKEAERISCDTIQKDLMVMNEDILFYNYVVENVLALDDQDSIKIALNRILNSKEDKKECLKELENIYKLAIIPRCATEEEWNSIIHLRGTLEEMENPFEVYYDLACFAHTLRCEEDHYQNEFGKLECPSIRQEMESGMSLGK